MATLSLKNDISPGTYVVIEVHDTGSGMDEHTISKIFDPFFTTKFQGRGLGLAAVQGIVRRHRGGLKVYSAPGKGSTFKLLLPAMAESASVPASTGSLQAASLSGTGTVLVVDDEPIVLKTAKRTLERLWVKEVLDSPLSPE